MLEAWLSSRRLKSTNVHEATPSTAKDREVTTKMVQQLEGIAMQAWLPENQLHKVTL